jgi:hypothetical protein
MKLFNKIIWLLLFTMASCSNTDAGPTTFAKNTNYGYNIIVAFDLSNRILREGNYDDPEILKLITDNLKTIFQKSIDVGINSKLYVTTINNDDFAGFNYSDSVFRIDLTRFKNDAVGRSDYLYHNDQSTNSLKHESELLNVTFSTFYDSLKLKGQKPADMWNFLQNKLTPPLIDTSSFTYQRDNVYITNRYKNYIIVITDGYIEAGRYSEDKSMRVGNKFRYFSGNGVKEFRDNFNNSGSQDFTQFYSQRGYGIMPVQNELLKDCKVLVLELDDRSVVNGLTTANPTDTEITKLFWQDWLVKSGIAKRNVLLKEKLPNEQYVGEIIKQFLEIK